MKLISTTAIALAILFFSAPAMAQDTEAVKKLSKEKIDIVIGFLQNKSLSKDARNKNIIDTVNPMLDFEQMAKLSLGKKNWVSMTKAQRQKFLDLFVLRLQESYLEKLDLYTDEKVVVEEAKQVKSRIHVITHLISSGDKMEMVYKFYKTKKNGWMVYDVVILGVSVVQTYRSQFSGFLKTGSTEDLLKKLAATGSFTIQTDKKK